MTHFSAPECIARGIINKDSTKTWQLGYLQLTVLGLLAGAFIAFGAQLASRMYALITLDAGVALLVAGAAFSVGLMLVVIAGAELFTGNNLMFMAVLNGKAKLGDMLLKWLVVYVANFLGALLIVWLMYHSQLVKGEAAVKAVEIAVRKAELGFGPAFFRGILCNWLVCLAVWMAMAAHDVVGKMLAIFVPVSAFVASGFEHSVANMYFLPMGHFIDASAVSWVSFFHNIIPVTLGNIIGGAGFVATLYWLVFHKRACKKDA
jgi:formate/nitrite transporter